MIAEFGHFALILALALAVAQGSLPLIGAQRGIAPWIALAPAAAFGQAVMTAFAFGCLTYAYVTSDFSVLNVAQNSHSLKPMLYKVSGVWGNHEGSLLLWQLILAVFGAAVAVFGAPLPATPGWHCSSIATLRSWRQTAPRTVCVHGPEARRPSVAARTSRRG